MKSVTMMRIAIKERKITQEKLCEYFGLNENTSFVYEVIGTDEDILKLRRISYSELERRYGRKFKNIKRCIDIGEIKMYN